MAAQIYGFIFVMWVLMLIGGGLMISFVAPISFAEDIDPIITSGTKVFIALFLIFIWVYTLTKVKNWIFRSQMKS